MADKFGKDWWQKEKKKWSEGDFSPQEEVERSESEIERAFSREYTEFKDKEKKEETSLYIKACKKVGGVFEIPPDQETKIKLKNAIRLLGWDIKPSQCVSVSIIGTLILLLASAGVLFSPIEMIFKLSFFVLPFAAMYYLMFYPHFKAKTKIIRSSEDLIFSVLYMIVYTHSSPNLEGAVKFAALNLSGPISEDLKKVLWDVDIGRYPSLQASLEHYTKRWEPYNRDYLQALQLIRAGINTVSDERRKELLQEASNTILQGTKEKMKHYSQELKMPVMLLNGMGIMLPILGMIALPISSIFMGSSIKPIYLVMVYNVMIPGTVYVIMKNVMSNRPPTTSVDPLGEGVLPAKGRYTIDLGEKSLEIPMILPAFLIFISMGFWGLSYYASLPELNAEPSLLKTSRSLLLVLSVAFSMGFYYYLGYKQRLNKQKKIEEMESEFSEALFELGHRLQEGTPVEVALEGSARSMDELEISNFFRRISRNIKNAGMTFRDAIFNNQYGAIFFFPSKLIKTVMRAVVEASRKGTEITSKTMITVSRYLQNLHITQEEINDVMEETTTTMKFVGYVLAPIVAGVAVSMAQIMSKALSILSKQFQDIPGMGGESFGTGTGTAGSGFGGSGATSGGGMLGQIINLQSAIPPDILQLVVGFYIIEILFIIGLFYVRIQHGENEAREKVTIGRLLIIGTLIYALITVAISLSFGGLITGLQGQLTGM